jgi:predicted nucleic acid-binding protein
MILVDSSVWIDFFNGKKTTQTDFLEEVLGKEIIGIGDLILTEVLQGFSSKSDALKAQENFEDLSYFSLVGKEVAIQAAYNYRELRLRGVTIRKTIDVLIGTFCIANDTTLLHCDKDFEPMVSYLGLKSIF